MRSRAAALTAFFLLAASAAAVADDVRIRSYHPLRYGRHADADAESSFTSGTASSGAVNIIDGDLTVNGDVTIRKDANTTLRVAPGLGPYNRDAIFVDANNNVGIGSNTFLPPELKPKLKVSTVLKARMMKVVDVGGGAPLGAVGIPTVYGLARAWKDASIVNEHLKRKAQFCARPIPEAVTESDPTAGPYGKLRIEAKIIQLGGSYVQRGGATYPGNVGAVLIGAMQPFRDPYTNPELYLQVGSPPLDLDPAKGVVIDTGGFGGGWRLFSSQSFKNSIEPLSAGDRAKALDDIASTPLFWYRYKDDAAARAPRLGVVAEELPEAIRSKNGDLLDIGQALAYAAAALKELETRNESLKSRIAELERAKAETAR